MSYLYCHVYLVYFQLLHSLNKSRKIDILVEYEMDYIGINRNHLSLDVLTLLAGVLGGRL